MTTLLSLLLIPALLSDPIPLGPLGGSATSIVVDPNDGDVVLVTHPTKGLLRSTDGGASFAPFGSGLPANPKPQALAADPQDGDGLYVGVGSGIWRSLDFGATWTALPVTTNATVTSIALPITGTAILASTGSQIWRAPAPSGPWSSVATGTILSNVVFAPTDPSIAFYGSLNGVFKSSNGGASFALAGTFTQWAKAVSVAPTDALRVLAGTTTGVQLSTNGGASFAPSNTGLPGGASVQFFSFDPNNGRLWLGLLDGLWFSNNQGGSWADGNAGFPGQPPIQLDMSFASVGPGIGDGSMFVVNEASNGGLWRTFGGPLPPWTHVGFSEVPVFDVLVTGPGGHRAASSFNGVFAAPAGGGTLQSTAWQFDLGTHTEVMVADPTDPTRWLVGGVGSFSDNANIGELEDNGATLVGVAYEHFGAGKTEAIAFAPDDPSVVLAGLFPAGFGSKGLVRSTDGGSSFSDVNGTIGYSTRAIAWDPFTTGRVLAYMDNNQWAVSTNHGATFSTLQGPWVGTGPGTFLHFDPFTANRLFRGVVGGAGPTAGLLISDDGGTGWTGTGIKVHERSDLVLHPQIPDLLFVSDADEHVWISGDAGQTFWQLVLLPDGTFASGLALDTLDGSLVYGTTNASAYELAGASPYVVLGEGTAGTFGVVPRHLPINGLPQPGSPSWGLSASSMLAGTGGYLLVSVFEVALPFLGGTLFAGPPWIAVLPFATGAGAVDFVFGLPNDPILLGVSIVSQVVVDDAGGPLGKPRVLSAGLRTTFGP